MRSRPYHLACRQRKRSCLLSCGFTLLEVLVVIGIIFVLVALSVPAMQSFISKSRSVGCQSSLRQLYIGAVSFAADNNGAIPYNYQGGWWIWKISEYAIPPSDKSPRDLMCPDSPKANGKQVAPRFGPANYGMNSRLACTLNNDGTVTASYGDKPLARLFRFTDLAAPASTVLYFDSGHLFQMQHDAKKPGGAWGYIPGFSANKRVSNYYAADKRITIDAHRGRHGGTVNFINADGSMGQLKADEFVNDAKNWEAKLR